MAAKSVHLGETLRWNIAKECFNLYFKPSVDSLKESATSIQHDAMKACLRIDTDIVIDSLPHFYKRSIPFSTGTAFLYDSIEEDGIVMSQRRMTVNFLEPVYKTTRIDPGVKVKTDEIATMHVDTYQKYLLTDSRQIVHRPEHDAIFEKYHKRKLYHDLELEELEKEIMIFNEFMKLMNTCNKLLSYIPATWHMLPRHKKVELDLMDFKKVRTAGDADPWMKQMNGVIAGHYAVKALTQQNQP